jgi:hypothetical protein
LFSAVTRCAIEKKQTTYKAPPEQEEAAAQAAWMLEKSTQSLHNSRFR